MPTLAETRILCRGSETEDPLYDTSSPEAEARLVDQDGSLYLPGSSGDGVYADDLLITPLAEGWKLQYRDPEGLDEYATVYGREWQDGGTHQTWDSLVGFAYSL